MTDKTFQIQNSAGATMELDSEEYAHLREELRLFGPVADRCGLPVEVCKGLLEAGWSYYECIEFPAVWRAPGWELEEKDVALGSPYHKTKLIPGDPNALHMTNYGQPVTIFHKPEVPKL